MPKTQKILPMALGSWPAGQSWRSPHPHRPRWEPRSAWAGSRAEPRCRETPADSENQLKARLIVMTQHCQCCTYPIERWEWFDQWVQWVLHICNQLKLLGVLRPSSAQCHRANEHCCFQPDVDFVTAVGFKSFETNLSSSNKLNFWVRSFQAEWF